MRAGSGCCFITRTRKASWWSSSLSKAAGPDRHPHRHHAGGRPRLPHRAHQDRSRPASCARGFHRTRAITPRENRRADRVRAQLHRHAAQHQPRPRNHPLVPRRSRAHAHLADAQLPARGRHGPHDFFRKTDVWEKICEATNLPLRRDATIFGHPDCNSWTSLLIARPGDRAALCLRARISLAIAMGMFAQNSPNPSVS